MHKTSTYMDTYLYHRWCVNFYGAGQYSIMEKWHASQFSMGVNILSNTHIEIWPHGNLTRGLLSYIEYWPAGHFSIMEKWTTL